MRFVLSPAYVFYGSIVDVLARVPSIRVLVLVRDPVDYLVSMYNHDVLSSGPSRAVPPFRKLATNDWERVPDGWQQSSRLSGRFSRYIETAMDSFGPDSVLLTHLHWIRDWPLATYTRVLTFLDVEVRFTSASSFSAHNVGRQRKDEKACPPSRCVYSNDRSHNETLRYLELQYFAHEYRALAALNLEPSRGPPALHLRSGRSS